MVFCGRHGFRTFTLNFKTEMFFKNCVTSIQYKKKIQRFPGPGCCTFSSHSCESWSWGQAGKKPNRLVPQTSLGRLLHLLVRSSPVAFGVCNSSSCHLILASDMSGAQISGTRTCGFVIWLWHACCMIGPPMLQSPVQSSRQLLRVITKMCGK